MSMYFTLSIPRKVAEKLKELKMQFQSEGKNNRCPSYAEVFDAFAGMGIFICILPRWKHADGTIKDYLPIVNQFSLNYAEKWYDAANDTIEVAARMLLAEQKRKR